MKKSNIFLSSLIFLITFFGCLFYSHADGSLKFWDASSVNLQILYKMKTAKLFERPKAPPAHYILPGGGGVGSGQSGNNGSSSSNQATGGGDKSGENGGSNGGENEDFFAIEYICFTAENRTLCVSGACSQVMVFKFNKQECSSEIGVSKPNHVLELSVFKNAFFTISGRRGGDELRRPRADGLRPRARGGRLRDQFLLPDGN